MAPSLAPGETISNDSNILKGVNGKLNDTAKTIAAGKIVDDHIDDMDGELRLINRKVKGVKGFGQAP